MKNDKKKKGKKSIKIDFKFNLFGKEYHVKRVQNIQPLAKGIALNDMVLVQAQVFNIHEKNKKARVRKVGRCIGINIKKKAVKLLFSPMNQKVEWHPLNICLPVIMKKKIRLTIKDSAGSLLKTYSI